MSTPTKDRDKVRVLLKNDKLDDAFQLASQISDPWFKCQALAFVARKTTDKKRRKEILESSFLAAKDLKEPNRVTTVSAWPLSLLSVIGRPKELEDKVEELLSVINTEPHPIRQSDGIFTLVTALSRGPRPAFLKIWNSFIISSKKGHGWKRDRNLKHAALLMKKVDLHKAKEVLGLFDKPIRRQQVLEKLEGPETVEERGLQYSYDYRYGLTDK